MNDKLELDIPVLLPDLPDAADACLDRLVSTLSKREGVERAHVICLDGNTPAALCIHFDDRYTIPYFAKSVQQRYMKILLFAL